MHIIPKYIKNNNDLNSKLELLKNIKRSFSVFRIDCGSCNGCEIEIFASLSPMWDPQRFGFKLVSNPRHADILIVSGPITRQMYYPLLRAYEIAPDPKIVVGFGACGCSGGIFHDSYAVWGGVNEIIPIDVFIPGCPPHPASIIYGLCVGVGLIEQKLTQQSYSDNTSILEIKSTSLLGMEFEKELLVKSKFLMGYIYGRVLYNMFIDILKSCQNEKDISMVKARLNSVINTNEDLRFCECLAILYNEIYLKYVKYNKEDIINLNEIW